MVMMMIMAMEMEYAVMFVPARDSARYFPGGGLCGGKGTPFQGSAPNMPMA